MADDQIRIRAPKKMATARIRYQRCGDAREAADYRTLLGDERAALIFTDPPYNVPIDGHVCGIGGIHHREFAVASGEMTADEFAAFLTDTLSHAAAVAQDGDPDLPWLPRWVRKQAAISSGSAQVVTSI